MNKPSEAAQKPGPLTCGVCELPIHPSETCVRYFGTYAAHSESRCIQLLKLAHAETREQLDEAQMKLEQTSRWSVANERDALKEQLAQAQLVLELCKRYFYDRRPIEPTSRVGKLVSSIDAALRAKQEPPQALPQKETE